MKDKPKDKLEVVSQTIKLIEKEFGTKVCADVDIDCANCKAQILLGYLNWYLELLLDEK